MEPQVGEQVGEDQATAPAGFPSRQRSRTRRFALRSVQVVLLGVAIRWLIIPRLGDTADVFGRLDEVSPLLLVLGTLLGVAALVAYAATLPVDNDEDGATIAAAPSASTVDIVD